MKPTRPKPDSANSAKGRPNLPTPAELLEEVRVRAELVTEPRPEGIKGPPVRRFLQEIDALAEPLRWLQGSLRVKKAKKPRVVMLLPGFGTHPVRMRRMAQKLEEAGHKVKRWGMGFNFGPTPENFELLSKRVQEIHTRYGKKVYLVGWSLGGVFARELARKHPDIVAKVITMGSPFSGDGHANNVWRIYHLITGHSVNNPPVGRNRAAKPPVPTVAMWSPRDGMVHPRSAMGKPGERDRVVALRCSHIGFSNSDEAIAAVLKELKRKD
jgi:dienelactone hydrolase